MTPQWPTPRAVPKGISFGSYHSPLFRATREFMKDVERAEQEVRDEVVRLRERLSMPAEFRPDIHVERYSMAVQVLAAMTIEAAVDIYAVVRFGEVAARSTWKRYHPRGIAGKLVEMLQAATGASPEAAAEILQIVDRIAKARNAFVHPKSDETLYDNQGNPLRTRQEHLLPMTDGTAARDTYDDLLRFFELLHELDPTVGGILHPW